MKSVDFTLFVHKINRPVDGIGKIDLSLHAIFPCRRAAVFQISHEGASSRIQGINNHFSVYGPGNFNSSV